ncbi:MAG: hypothetical protein HWN81_00340 [Candidatus Lokiarchaeota archaeon]|nr:hypothetical protein [Candidatus Lokiarchaeota archaeon]
MYKCKKCKNFTELGEKMEKIVVKTRNKIYTKINRRGHEIEAGTGWEIVKEIEVCKACYKAHCEELNE